MMIGNIKVIECFAFCLKTKQYFRVKTVFEHQKVLTIQKLIFQKNSIGLIYIFSLLEYYLSIYMKIDKNELLEIRNNNVKERTVEYLLTAV